MSRSLPSPDLIEGQHQVRARRSASGLFRFSLQHRFILCAFALLVSLSANVATVLMLNKIYVDARTAAVFPPSGNPHQPGGIPAQKTGPRIVLFGDSRIAQWQNFPVRQGAEVVMKGVPGETTAQMRVRFARDVLDLDPDAVVLQLGINDLVAIGVLPERQSEIALQCEANMRFFVEALRERNIRTILLTIIPPARPPFWRRPFWNADIASAVERINRNWLSAPASSNLRVVDTRALLQDREGRWIDGVTADALHITALGYGRLNAVVGPLLEE